MKKKMIVLFALVALCTAAIFANPNMRVVCDKEPTCVRKTSIPFSTAYKVPAGTEFEYMTQYTFFYVVFPLDTDGTYFISKKDAHTVYIGDTVQSGTPVEADEE